MVLYRLLGLTRLQARGYREHQYYRNKPVTILWRWIQLVDLLLFFTFKIKIPLRLGYRVVADRFIHDILVELMVEVNDPELYKSHYGRFMLALIPTGTFALLFDLDEEAALQRKGDIPDSRYLTLRRHYYQDLCRDLGVTSIDSSRPYEVVHEALLQKIKEERARVAANHIRIQLRNRIQARARWKKWKKGPVAILRRYFWKVAYQLIGKAEITRHGKRNEEHITQRLQEYARHLRSRGLHIHTVVLVGSGAKNRLKPESDLDIIVVADPLPKGLTARWSRAMLLSDFPLSLGVEPYGCSKEEFLQKLQELDLMALDAFCCGKVMLDDGFWLDVRSAYRKLENEYSLDTRELGLELSRI